MMTCIVGIVHGSTVYIGADSAEGDTATYAVARRSDPKAFRRGRFLFGFTTSWRMGQLLAHRLKIPALPRRGVSHKWMCTKFIDAVRKCLADGGWIRKKDEREAAGTFLVGVQGKLFAIGDNLQVAQYARPYTAIGCGASCALGSLFSTAGDEPHDRIIKALQAAEEFSAYVRGPFIVISEKRAKGPKST